MGRRTAVAFRVSSPFRKKNMYVGKRTRSDGALRVVQLASMVLYTVASSSSPRTRGLTAFSKGSNKLYLGFSHAFTGTILEADIHVWTRCSGTNVSCMNFARQGVLRVVVPCLLCRARVIRVRRSRAGPSLLHLVTVALRCLIMGKPLLPSHSGGAVKSGFL
ncbi:hypothetical protein VTK73DRAFT_2224 [Phialemonium thermophilum]|uniref:Uncharacterized protein n=1 Tax=Phialemonium thermophilum TaxID=223376 RepID=A0ABR3X5I7_9PEZI